MPEIRFVKLQDLKLALDALEYVKDKYSSFNEESVGTDQYARICLNIIEGASVLGGDANVKLRNRRPRYAQRFYKLRCTLVHSSSDVSYSYVFSELELTLRKTMSYIRLEYKTALEEEALNQKKMLEAAEKASSDESGTVAEASEISFESDSENNYSEDSDNTGHDNDERTTDNAELTSNF